MSLVSSFESVIHQIENHEAMVAAAIREAEQNGHRAKAQLQRVKRDGHAMRQKLLELKDQAASWQSRAKQTGESDPAKALECLRRCKRLHKQLEALEVQEREHSKRERQLTEDLSTVEERLIALRQQRNIMRTRQSRAEALRLIQQVDSTAVSEIDDIFARWEAHVSSAELTAGAETVERDDFEDAFESAEEEEVLRAELTQLLQSGNSL
jgi:phage shock protein A